MRKEVGVPGLVGWGLGDPRQVFWGRVTRREMVVLVRSQNCGQASPYSWGAYHLVQKGVGWGRSPSVAVSWRRRVQHTLGESPPRMGVCKGQCLGRQKASCW